MFTDHDPVYCTKLRKRSRVIKFTTHRLTSNKKVLKKNKWSRNNRRKEKSLIWLDLSRTLSKGNNTPKDPVKMAKETSNSYRDFCVAIRLKIILQLFGGHFML